MVYIYLEADDSDPGTRARIISPTIPEQGVPKCLSFSYSVFGEHVGNLRVLNEIGEEIWSFSRVAGSSMSQK